MTVVKPNLGPHAGVASNPLTFDEAYVHVEAMLRTSSPFLMLMFVSAATGQTVNITGLWATGAGAPYTIDERGGSGKITVIPGTYQKANGLGWLERTSNPGELQGEVLIGGCWVILSLRESDEGTVLSGTLRVNAKKSTRGCRSLITKEAKAGEPSPFRLLRQPRLPPE